MVVEEIIVDRNDNVDITLAEAVAQTHEEGDIAIR